MEAPKSGVFSPYSSLDAVSMIKCLQALLKNFPSIRFDSVISDGKNHGFKVYFSEPDESEVLQRNELFLEGPVWIYPLTTYLIIENLDHKKNPFLERELRDAIKENFGKVIHIIKPDHSKNWFIEIDIPEFKGLKAFKDLAEYRLPIKSINKEVILKQWCRQCNNSGHFQHECSKRLGKIKNKIPKMEKKGTSSNKKKVGENFKEPVASSLEQNLKNRPKKFFNISLETTDSYAEKIGREEVMSFSKKKQKENNTKADTGGNINNNSLTESSIKKEIEDFPSNINQKIDINRRREDSQFSENDCHTKSKLNEEISYNSGDFSSSDEDDISIIEDTNTSTSNKFQVQGLNSSRVAEINPFDEESRSSDTKNQFNYFSIFSSTNPGPSYEPPFSQAAKPSRGAEVTTSLSERLQDCINQVCDNVRVLDRKQLDAFLIHVKKKSNPIRVALKYTPNTKGLKEQLQAILDMYYNTPQTGTKEDIQFIKWLSGLIERFDGSIPKKRKRGAKGDDVPPTKR